MKTRISATAAARNFSELLNRVCYRGESFVVERGGKPVCEIVPPAEPKLTWAEFAALLKSLPKPDDEYLDILEDITRNQPTVEKSPWER